MPDPQNVKDLFVACKKEKQEAFDRGFLDFCKPEGDERRMEINKTYDECQKFLDIEFEKEFPKPKVFLSRLWELWVCYSIIKSSYSKNLCKPKSQKGGADFILDPGKNDKKICIECVAPNEGKKAFEGGDFIYTGEFENDISFVTQSGIDSFIVSRFTSVLKDKSEIVSDYKESSGDDFYILAINGYNLHLYQNNKMCCESRGISVSEDFETALLGKKHIFLEKEIDQPSIEYSYYNVKKQNKTKITTGLQEYLSNFDAIIFSEELPFCVKPYPYKFYYRDSKKEDVLKAYLTTIFPKRPA